MADQHGLLKRQLRRTIGETASLSDTLQEFIESVNRAYFDFEDDRRILERSLDLSSEELLEANEELSRHRENLEKLVRERTEELQRANAQLTLEIAQRRKTENRLAALNQCILGSGHDTRENINRLVALCGEQLGAACALYNRIENGMLCTVAQWNAPPDYDPVDEPEGHICYDVIRKGGDQIWAIRDLQNTSYARTDRNVLRYNLKTYVGKSVRVGEDHVGSLCGVFQDDHALTETDEKFIGIVAIAIRTEEERQWAATALRESEEKIHSISVSAQDAIIMIDRGGAVTYWNPAAERILGYRSDEMLGKDLHTCLAPEQLLRDFERSFGYWQVTGKGNAVGRTTEWTALTKNGRPIPVEVSLSSVMIRNQWHGIGILRDITERKYTEDALRKAKEAAESASTAKSQFLAKMSHEIRTPMNGVLGVLELLMRERLTDHHHRLVRMAQSSGKALLNIINEVLDFSRIEAGKLELVSSDFDLRETLVEVVEIFASHAQSKGIQLISDISPALPSILHGDPDRLRQILVNIIGNALKFTDHGEVIIRVRCDRLQHDRVLLRFEISDTGIGISAEARCHIFDSFSQADGSMTRKYGGSGLGLTIARQLTELMGGTIRVESELGRGSTFWFLIPMESGQTHPSAKPAADRERPLKVSFRGRVLLAEDNPVNQEVVRGMLEFLGCEVESVYNGQEALDQLVGARYDLVFMDCQMPEMDGYAATREIRAGEATERRSRIPIVALTGHAMQGDRELCLASGMDDYLVKPCSVAQLTDILRRWLPLSDT